MLVNFLKMNYIPNIKNLIKPKKKHGQPNVLLILYLSFIYVEKKNKYNF